MVRRTLMAAAVVLLVAGLGATTGFAQSSFDTTVFSQADTKAQAEQAALEAMTRDRTGLVAGLVGRWRDSVADGGEELEALLMRAPIERVWQASQARDFDAFRGALAGRGSIRNVFGQTDGDLVFTPVAPCRIFDTRAAAAGILVAGVVRNFGVNGDMTAQGGSSTGCGIPVDPLAVVFNLAAVTPTGAGNIRAWAYSDPVPTAAALNYNPTNTSPALSNMITVPVCYVCGTGLDISLRSDAANVHAVGDIVGYFLDPVGLPSPRIATFNSVSVASTNTALTSITFTPTHSGYALALGTAWCNISGPGTNVIIGFGETASPWDNNGIEHNNGTGLSQNSLAAQTRISMTAGTPLTIELTGRKEVGAAGLFCTGSLSVTELY
jgi:hypothetical protein